MNRDEQRRFWHLITKRITIYRDTFKIEWKNAIITQGSLRPVSMCGAEGGT
jgi:hypothetical protein